MVANEDTNTAVSQFWSLLLYHRGLILTLRTRSTHASRCLSDQVCMCDTRRAVVIVNAIQLAGCVIGLILMSIAAKRNNDGTLQNSAIRDLFVGVDSTDIIAAFSVVVIRMLFSWTGLMGALHYNVCMVGTCFVWYVIQAVSSAFAHVWGFMALCIVFAYVHIYFIMEVNSGIMSPATYPVEKHSCCCV
jgi:hypothetical protein